MSSVAPLLAVEIGNSRVKFGVFLDGLQSPADQLPNCQRMLAASAEMHSIPWDQLQSTMTGSVPQCIVSSVNPPATERFLREWTQTGWAEPVVIRSFTQLPITNQTSPPEQTGLDRLLKGVAGNVLRLERQPLILVDSGTAITVDWITPSGAFAGGAILPGLNLSSQALYEHTAQLPLIATDLFDHLRPTAIGTNTNEAIQSGLYWGHVGAVRELIQRLSTDHSGPVPLVLITGGTGRFLARELDLSACYRQDLTLQGLAITARHLWPLDIGH